MTPEILTVLALLAVAITLMVTELLRADLVALLLAVTLALTGIIAVAAAQQTGAEPRAIAMAVAMGCCMVFMTPMSHPVNVFMMGPGGYSFRDFLRVGLPLTLLLFLTVLIVLPLFWPLR